MGETCSELTALSITKTTLLEASWERSIAERSPTPWGTSDAGSPSMTSNPARTSAMSISSPSLRRSIYSSASDQADARSLAAWTASTDFPLPGRPQILIDGSGTEFRPAINLSKFCSSPYEVSRGCWQLVDGLVPSRRCGVLEERGVIISRDVDQGRAGAEVWRMFVPGDLVGTNLVTGDFVALNVVSECSSPPTRGCL